MSRPADAVVVRRAARLPLRPLRRGVIALAALALLFGSLGLVAGGAPQGGSLLGRAAASALRSATSAVQSDPGGLVPDGDSESLPLPAISWRGTAPWQIAKRSSWAYLTEVFTSSPSYLPGETLRLAVSTSAATYDVTIWRLGATPTLVARSEPLKGARQKNPIIDWSTGLVHAPWNFTYSRPIGPAWRSGIYLARVHGTRGADAYATFVVRSTRPAGLLFVVNTLTDTAYNRWGGASLYRLDLHGVEVPVNHAVAVSLDRPNALQDGAGSTFSQTWPTARWLEQQGYDVSFTTDWDLSRVPSATPLPAAIVFSGHSEYWTPALRSWLDLHVVQRGDMGLALFGANTGYWPVTLSRDGRTMTSYKEAVTAPGYVAPTPTEAAASAEPAPSAASGASAGASAGPIRQLRFRDQPLPAAAVPHPEQLLFGAQYGSQPAADGEYTVGANLPADLLAGTDLEAGDSLGRIVGGETDAIDPTIPPADGLVTIATSSFTDIYGTTGSGRRGLPGAARRPRRLRRRNVPVGLGARSGIRR